MNEWYIFSKTSKNGKEISCEVCEGTNRYGDGPDRTIGTFYSVQDAEMICKLHNGENQGDVFTKCVDRILAAYKKNIKAGES